MMAKPKEKFKTRGDVFDQFTVRNLFKLSSQGHFEEDSLTPLSIGKEANVFSALRNDGTGIILKIYRLETSDFNKMYDYLRVDPNYENVAHRRRQVIFSWAQREYRTLLKAREVIRVPNPMTCMFNILLQEFIGDEDAAPKLKDAELKDPAATCDEVLLMMKKLYQAGLVHGDLSEYNILFHRNMPVFIDFSHGTPTRAQNAKQLLERDLKNVLRFFAKEGVTVDFDAALSDILVSKAEKTS